jgi:NitT/TauT family transport system permease protein
LPAADVDRRLSTVLPIIAGAGFLLAWQAIVSVMHISPVILPTPVGIAAAFVSNASSLAYESLYTGGEAVVACILATVFGLAVALILASSRIVRETIYPWVVAAQFIPKVALAPLFIVWLGIGSPSRLVFAVFMSFFPVAIATLAGLLRTSPAAVRLCQSLNATTVQTLFHVRLPYAMPYVFSGMRVAATFAVLGVLVGEFISAQHGLGGVLLTAASRADTALVFAAIFVLCLIGLGLFGAVVLAERRLRHHYAL